MAASELAAIALHALLLVVLPLPLVGLIGKTKAIAAGRRGPPILQPTHDVIKLLRKGAVYSRSTSWVLRAGPIIALATALVAGLLLPMISPRAPLGFAGDVILFAYLLGLGRFFTIAAALDTGSSFEGMGASREAAFSAMAEPALFLALAIVCVPAQTVSFEQAWTGLPWASWGPGHPAYVAAAVTLFLVMLAECSRMPVDDPNTHLELTMIHEVMVLDHGGPDLGLVLYGAAVKLFVLATLVVHVLLPIPPGGGWRSVALFLGGQIGVAIIIGVVESTMARLRLVRVPQFLVGASVIAALGLASIFYRGAP